MADLAGPADGQGELEAVGASVDPGSAEPYDAAQERIDAFHERVEHALV